LIVQELLKHTLSVRGDLVLGYYQKKIFKAKKRTIMNELLFVKVITKIVFFIPNSNLFMLKSLSLVQILLIRKTMRLTFENKW
jgi:hypothetical protein